MVVTADAVPHEAPDDQKPAPSTDGLNGVRDVADPVTEAAPRRSLPRARPEPSIEQPPRLRLGVERADPIPKVYALSAITAVERDADVDA